MMSRFSSFVLALLLLVASGQVMATAYYSKVANPALDTLVLTDWSESACHATTMPNATTTFSGTTDTLTICGTVGLFPGLVTGVTGAIGGATVNSITIASGASVTLTGSVTTANVNLALVNNGTLVIPAANTLTLGTTASTYTGTGTLDSTCTAAAGVWTTPATWGTTTRCGIVTVTAATVPASPGSLTDVIIPGVAVTGATGTVRNLTLNNTSSALTLGGAMTVTGNVVSNTGSSALTIGANTLTLGGNLTTAAAGSVVGTGSTLALTDAIHTLNLGGALTVATITSAMTAGKAFTVGTSAIGATTITGFGTCTGGTITATSIPAASYTCGTAGGGSVAAPIFSTKEKAGVFTEEVKH